MRLRHHAVPLIALVLLAACGKYAVKDTLFNRAERIKRKSAIANPFGANNVVTRQDAGTQAYDLQVTLAGIAWDRELFQWDTIEPKPRQLDWSGTDRIVELARACDMQLLPVLDHCATWARHDILEKPEDKVIQVPNSIHWGNYVRAAVGRYKGEVRFWEIWNRPDDPGHFAGSPAEYVRVLKTAYAEARAADSDCVVLMGAVADAAWLAKALASGAAKNCDVIGLALTPSKPKPPDAILIERKPDKGNEDAPPDGEKTRTLSLAAERPFSEARELMAVRDQLERFKSVLENHKIKKPVWITSAKMKPAPAEAQARFLVKFYATAMAYGADCVFLESFVSERDGSVSGGLLYPDLSRRPAAKAYAMLSMLLANVVSARIVKDNPGGLTVYEFRSLTELIRITWSKREDVAQLPVGYKQVHDINGVARALTPDEEESGQLTVGPDPLFITARIVEQGPPPAAE